MSRHFGNIFITAIFPRKIGLGTNKSFATFLIKLAQVYLFNFLVS